MNNRERFLDGQIFHILGFSSEQPYTGRYRYCAPNGEFAMDKIQRNTSSICYNFKDYCDITLITGHGVIFSISVFGKIHHDVLHFENMVFEEGGEAK